MNLQNKKFYEKYIQTFLEQNNKLNLISKNDEKFLWEKHISDSLAISNVFDKYGIPKTLLDIGTGGGFPSVPIALTYPKIQVYALDSIRKKINAIETIKNELKITNLNTICDRAENLSDKYDMITSRAVATLDKIVEYAIPLLNDNSYFIAYKSRKVQEEINLATKILNKYNAKIIDIIEYKLPLAEEITRNLVIIKK